MTEDPAAASAWTSLGDPGARSERGGGATQRRATPPPSPPAKGFPEPCDSMLAAMAGRGGMIPSCCDPPGGEEAGRSTDDSAGAPADREARGTRTRADIP